MVSVEHTKHSLLTARLDLRWSVPRVLKVEETSPAFGWNLWTRTYQAKRVKPTFSMGTRTPPLKCRPTVCKTLRIEFYVSLVITAISRATPVTEVSHENDIYTYVFKQSEKKVAYSSQPKSQLNELVKLKGFFQTMAQIVVDYVWPAYYRGEKRASLPHITFMLTIYVGLQE